MTFLSVTDECISRYFANNLARPQTKLLIITNSLNEQTQLEGAILEYHDPHNTGCSQRYDPASEYFGRKYGDPVGRTRGEV